MKLISASIAIFFSSVFALSACSNSESSVANSTQSSSPSAAILTDAAKWESNNTKITFLMGKVTPELKSITEPAHFDTSSAVLGVDGKFVLTIDLKSISTDIDIRNQRLKDWFFETSKFPVATVTGQLDSAQINQLKLGETLLLDQNLSLNLHGVDIPIQAALLISRVDNNRMIVNTRTPVIVDIGKIDMLEEMEKLMEGIGVSTIIQQVPISFYGEFSRIS
ncbi:YceI family protein [Kingella negevensis]|uniref:YceI family protein n=1 Tax=Kingella negevensis TaxID=1522312 RepID=UPI00254B7E3F|nr:YceI family protein [Kingella negevensis]MDK4679321.1 YceI family protein [Kingella negevensis]MDK4682958.1 YceI family protein [Kingella negevensis]MDK4691158.1 YceI family protein [Kingella negevensis]MDK4693694.1 YceI family protein [Kingella negevensis]MDK4700510.1 YceI family protein [Kingella negevensis]